MGNKLYTTEDMGRQVSEESHEKYRHDFRRDYARLTHSPAFRRLQGKTQLFPSLESDFFRNRLTHSLEVAQIAKSIAIKLNNTASPFCDSPDNHINTELVEFASLAHDLGHPPFGHNGEMALDECMKPYGGFEGNAQTLRILSRIEKKVINDERVGLNLTYRSLAAILKYDNKISEERINIGVQKGYYGTEASLVSDIKKAVTGDPEYKNFKTIECSIMDIADDIAYSTYDLEDSLKAGFMSFVDLISLPAHGDFFDKLAEKVWHRTYDYNKLKTPTEQQLEEVKEKIWIFFIELVSVVLPNGGSEIQHSGSMQGLIESINNPKTPKHYKEVLSAVYTNEMSKLIQFDGHYRTKLTSKLVGRFIEKVKLDDESDHMSQQCVYFDDVTKIEIEALKNFTYQKHILSPRLKVTEFRGQEFVTKLFKTLSNKNDKGYMNLPDDWKTQYLKAKTVAEEARIVCDFIAGMTDRYALEFYGRLFSETPQSIFKNI